MNTIKKRLKSDSRKARILMLFVILSVMSVIGYFALTMPMPQATNSKEAFEEDEKKLERAKEEHRRKQH